MPTKTATVSKAVFSNPMASVVVAIKEDDLVRLLMQNKGATAVTIVSRTEPDMYKRNNPHFGNVFKVSRVNGMIGWVYANAVNRQREREGKTDDFTAHPRPWGQRLAGTPLVENKGKYYLELKVEKSLDHRFEDVNGNVMSDSDIAAAKKFFKPKSASRQGVDKEIILRDYAIGKILSITYKGTCYLVTH